MVDKVKRTYEQMPDPKAVICVGNCGNTGDVFYESYNLVGPVDKILPVDVYVIGCPPRPENIIYGISKAWEKLETLEATTRQQIQLLLKTFLVPSRQNSQMESLSLVLNVEQGVP